MSRIFLLCLILLPAFSFAQTLPKRVARNFNAPIEVRGNIIRQDKRNIGFVRLLEQNNNGKPANVYQVLLPNGTQIAAAFSYGKGSHDWIISILNEPDVTFMVDSKAGSDVLDIAKILIKNGYL